jgi:hypothetical protein
VTRSNPNPADPSSWARVLGDRCRHEVYEIRLRAAADAETEAAQAQAEANAVIARRLARLRTLRDDLVLSSARIEGDLVRTAAELRRRTTTARGAGDDATRATGLTYSDDS